MNANAWTSEQKTRAAELWALDHSASEIGLQLGKSRSAVCGMLARMGHLKSSPRAGARTSPPNRAVSQKVLVRALRAASTSTCRADALALEPTGGHPALTSRGHCKFMRPQDLFCCGRPVEVAGSSWCDAHRLVVYAPRAAA